VDHKTTAFIRLARVARLATADKTGRPHVIPICFALDGKELYSPIDEKPKNTSPLRLKRIRNIKANPHIAVVIDRYEENWQRLAYVLIRGRAKILLKGPKHKRAIQLLRKKYPQYRKMRLEDRPVIQITISRWRSWGAV
jgi:coenzyme F420-0:L-glutamate ligase/coenzyme F420-1:gamma-L-glutamate ligase